MRSAVCIIALWASQAVASPSFPEKFYCLGDQSRATPLRLQVAATPETQAHGLMYRDSLVPFDGMLFDFGEPRIIMMWMKNTPLPLDMLFIDKNGKVVQKILNTVPFSEAIITSENAVSTVIELEAGRADKEGFDIGMQLVEGGCAVRADGD